MHTYVSQFCPVMTAVVFNYNADTSGEVLIRCGDKEIAIPGRSLMDFVADVVRHQRIAAIENMTTEELLK